jgi:D-glycero-D-manno-heptose 1,7-bisphosphate phosphatase
MESSLEAIYFCPHGPDDGCDCHKQAPGNGQKNYARFGTEEVVVIGDSGADRRAAGVTGYHHGPRGQASTARARDLAS